jgi:hypothetical protein
MRLPLRGPRWQPSVRILTDRDPESFSAEYALGFAFLGVAQVRKYMGRRWAGPGAF